MLRPTGSHVAEVLALGKPVIAVLVTLSFVLVSALAMAPKATPQASGDAPPAPSSPETSSATVFGSIDFSPSVLNIHSEGKYVTVRLTMPDGYPVSSVYIPSVRFMGSVYAETCFSDHETGAEKANSPHLMIKFLREDVTAVLSPADSGQVFLIGALLDGTPLYASGTLTVTA